jgi:DNA-binding transcriptional regulator YiaG
MTYTHTTKVGCWTVKDGGAMPARTMKDGTPVLSAEQLGAYEVRAAITVLSEVELVGGDELRFARKAMGLKQTDLAQHIGVTAETVSRWETGAEAFKRPIQLAVLCMLKEYQQSGRLTPPSHSPGARDRVLLATRSA